MEPNKGPSESLEDPIINIKFKLCSLWVALTLCYLYGDYFELYVPGKVEGLISGENALNSPVELFVASLLLAIPALMVYLSIALKPRINRWLNIVFGILFTVIMLVIGLFSITAWYVFYVFLAFVEIVISSLIVWHAIKWPKQEAPKS